MSSGIAPNAMIDSVRLELLIGRGGMGDIWQGLNTRDQTRVAVKVLREEFLQSTQARERFRREAELTEQLNSSQTLKVIKYALTPDRVPYIIMELLEGVDLQSLIDRDGPVDLVDSLEIMIEVLKAITEAHQLGIIHRDIKPSNLFRLQQTRHSSLRVKILDFGLATQHNHSQNEMRDTSLLGTYYFMAPEQAERGLITIKTDLYSFGATLFALLTGHPPRLPKAGDKSFDHYQQPPPTLRDKNPTIKAPAKLDLLIQRCLAKNPAQRPESADVLRRALDQLLSSIKRTAQRIELEGQSLAPSSQEANTYGASENSLAPSSFASQSTPRSNGSSYDHSMGRSFEHTVSLPSFLAQNRDRLTQLWTQTITERPNQSRLQTHNLKRKVDRYIEIFIELASKRPISSINSFLENLSQLSFTHPPLDLIPMITLSLFRRVCRELFSQQTDLQYSSMMVIIDDLIFHFRQQFILTVRQKRLEETNNALYRLFSAGSETPLLCTLAGVAINTHPRLRSSLVGDEKSGLTGRKLFEILDGFQPIHPLYQDLRELDKDPPKKPHRLNNEESGGLANEIIIYPHTIGKQNQLKMLIIVDMISERSITEYIPSIEFDDLDFASPQALPWQMTSEVPALKPEQLEMLDSPHHNKGTSSLPDLSLQKKRHGAREQSMAARAHSGPLVHESSFKPMAHSRAIQKSGVWDNYQQEVSHSVRAQQAPLINDPPLPLPYISEPPQHDHIDDHAEGFDQSSSHQSLSTEEESYYKAQGVVEEVDHTYLNPDNEDQHEWTRDHRPDVDPMHGYEVPSKPVDDSNADFYEVSVSPPAISPTISYPIGTSSSHPSRHGSSSIHDRYVYVTSRPPRAPDAQEYLRQGSSHPVKLKHPHSPRLEERRVPEDRREIDSSAPTDPPKQSIDGSVGEDHFSQEYQSVRPNKGFIVEMTHSSETSLRSPTGPKSIPIIPQQVESPSTYLPPSISSQDDRGPITFNRRGPQQNFTPPVPVEVPAESPRMPVQRQNARISSIQNKVTTSSSWVFNTLVFTIFVGCLFVLRSPVTQWLKTVNSESRLTDSIEPTRSSTNLPIPSTNNNLSTEVDRNTLQAELVVTVKVNVNKATFSDKSSGQILCKGVGFCAMKIVGVIVVRSPGYYDLYLDPKQLSQYADKTLFVEMEADPQ